MRQTASRSPRDSIPRRTLATVIVVLTALLAAGDAGADSPELAMRDFASGQIKKGVRSIGFGGDGATWGNYGLVWKDVGTALADYGDTSYSNGNDLHFAAIGATTPALSDGLAIYLIGMSEGTNNLELSLKSPGLGPGATPVIGTGVDNALFSKLAMPFGRGFSAGILLSYEKSHFDAAAIADASNTIRYETQWRPSGGFGAAWQPNKQLLFGIRALVNNDEETRKDASGVRTGLARSVEFRIGGSVSPWGGALIDLGGTRLEKQNAIAGTHTTTIEPNVGFEQALFGRRLTLRVGVDETSPTAGLSVRYPPVKIDAGFVRDMARNRVGTLFGDRSNSVLLTFTIDYAALAKRQ